MRKVVFPIHLKLTSLVLIITGISLACYIWLALDLFKSDKIAYVFEGVEQRNQQFSLILEESINNIRTSHKVLAESPRPKKVSGLIFEYNPALEGFMLIQKNKRVLSILKDLSIESWLLERSKKLNDKEGLLFIDNKKYLVHYINNGAEKTYVLINFNSLIEKLPKSKLYQQSLVLNGKMISGELTDEEVKLLNNDSSIIQTKVIGNDTDRKIISTSKVFEDNLTFITSINYNKALKASSVLRERSLYFGLLVAGFVILAILLFSTAFTAPIKKLYAASIELSKTNFSFRVNLKQKDEMGVLGDSFNFMAQEIQTYMEEMKEKTRLENEVKTAQLVQKSFFPTDKISGEMINLKAYYRPAAECGGDWWGYLKLDRSEIIILLDVTGHGTAAALMTAVIHNSLTALKHLNKTDKSYSESSSKIMNFLNDSFSSVDINLNATAFVAVMKDQKLVYTNASHNPPYYLAYKSDDYQKSDFTPLMEKIGPRLGEKKEQEYEEVSLTVNQKDHIVLYTDGILEAENIEGKQYGTRKFIKTLSENLNKEPTECLENTLNDFYAFLNGVEPNDDVSVINMEIKG